MFITHTSTVTITTCASRMPMVSHSSGAMRVHKNIYLYQYNVKHFITKFIIKFTASRLNYHLNFIFSNFNCNIKKYFN